MNPENEKTIVMSADVTAAGTKTMRHEYPRAVVTETMICAGMTIRDEFAARAMQAALTYGSMCTFKELAKKSYQIADAMMEARGG